jgi:glutamate-1-semialdehyde 2,1-aminomutase
MTFAVEVARTSESGNRMTLSWMPSLALLFLVLVCLRLAQQRLRLSLAKNASLGGHARLSRLLAKWVRTYQYQGDAIYGCDAAPPEIRRQREEGLEQLSRRLNARSPRTRELGLQMESAISDLQFTNAYRVPFQFRNLVRDKLAIGAVAVATSGTKIQDLDGNWSHDASGSYGVNLLGYDAYKSFMDRGIARVRELGPVLGPYHPIVQENVAMLKQVSGLDEVSFHMSGTEAVMQAVRLARFHTGRSQLVQFCGAYHGWWDGVQPGIGNGRSSSDIYTLKDMSNASLKVLATRHDIACVLVNPLQALHPNAGASSDGMLIASDRRGRLDRAAYAEWLGKLRAVCTERSIVLIFDEVFVGFRLGLGGAQEYFGVRADMVTYGKTVGGGLPVGVVCGKAALMKRFREDHPMDICFARGTFNSHPYVMASMNEFLHYATGHGFKVLMSGNEQLWNARAARLNSLFEHREIPVRVCNLTSIWMLIYPQASRYNWMFQFYLRAEGIALSWVGTGRLIFSLNYTDDDFDQLMANMINAGEKMKAAGWWWRDTSLSNRSIKRQVLKETLAASLFPRGSVSKGNGGRGVIQPPQPTPALDSPRPGQ